MCCALISNFPIQNWNRIRHHHFVYDLKRELTNVFQRIKIDKCSGKENLGKSLLKQNKYQRRSFTFFLFSFSSVRCEKNKKKKTSKAKGKKNAWGNCNDVLIYAPRLRVGFRSLFICDSLLRGGGGGVGETKTFRKFVPKSKLKMVPGMTQSYRYEFVA